MPDTPLPIPAPAAGGAAAPVPAALKGPPGPVGAATVPQPMHGHAAGSMVDIRNAVQALQKALPGIPLGTELHAAVLKAVTDITKRLDPSDRETNKGVDIQGLLQQAKQQQQGSPLASMLKAAEPGGGGGAAPALPPPPQLSAAA